MKQPLFALLAAVLAAGAFAAETSAPDGLVPITVKHIDAAWYKPDTSLSGYSQVLIRPVTVTFSDAWHPRDFGGGLKSSDVERIRSDVATWTNESFERVLTRGGYEAAAAPGQKVLDVQVEIIDLYINGPDTLFTPLHRIYVRSVGEMRVVITLRDSVTGTVLYRLSDRKRGDDLGPLELATAAYNYVEMDRLLTQAAQALSRLLART